MMTNSHSDDPNDTSSTLPPELQETPFLRTSSTLSPSGPLTFSTVIEDDHSRINAIAMTLGRALSRSLSPHQTLSAIALKDLRQNQLDLLNDLTWRLIRHDVSEDLIMRPTFARYLGREGEEMGDHDRKDHEHARAELLDLYTAFETLPTDIASADTSIHEKTTSQFKLLARRYKTLMTELAEHMKIESGQQIPRLEGILGRQESEELARRYLATYVLEPGLRVKGRRVWEGGVAEYMRVGREGFARVWGEVLEEGGEGKRKRGGGKL